ncbi:MAG TPA: energy transducer TonB [Polyangia bacterium]|nr:energy transducer TonB [Polyangia bacterium]
MSRRADLATLAVAVVVHLGFAAAIAREHVGKRPASSTVELEFQKAPPPIAEARPAATAGPPHAAAAPKPRRQLALRARPTPTHAAPAAAAPAAAAPAPVAPGPPRPMFGVSMTSTSVVAAGVAVPVGSTTLAHPGPPGGGAPGRAMGGAPSGDGEGAYQPASESDVATMPEVDTDACGKSIAYPDEAAQAGVEGDVRLRVALTPEGHVYAVRVLSGLGHGLDRAAMEALKHHCHFSPAVDKTGKRVAFVIQSYTFHFQLPR